MALRDLRQPPEKPGAATHLRERTKPSGKTYYSYDAGGKPRKEVPLGSDYGLAIMKYAELERDRNADNLAEKIVTLRYVSAQYFLDVVPKKAPSTQKKDAQYLVKLMEFFDDPPGPLDSTEPQHVYQYMRWRSDAPVSANREKALLSHMWNYARKMGYTKLANSCSGISDNPEAGRDVYIEDDLYLLVYQHFEIGLQEAMDLAYLTGQRPGDVLAMDERDIRDGMLHAPGQDPGEAPDRD
ncbi:hypothetical protein [Pseudomonas pseudonitroreducens]|uniref:hypothetical protein n=1 Tax=Pseudomonas pseudonitroreducens TaxID=2892326 RepID=UPI00283A985F|nr:hypothetical protein [Pseudomonas pseudonitroreducens]